MGALCNGPGDLVEMYLHGAGIGFWHHDGRTGSARRTDGAEQIGILIALIGRLAWPGSFAGPQANDTVLLTDACFILPPDLYCLGGRNAAQVGGKRVVEVFLKASITRASCLGCCGRALMWEKPRSCKICETWRSE